ncbi:hypothetical protein [Thermococcus sp.]
MELWLEFEKELAKEEVRVVKEFGLEDLIPRLFDSDDRLYALAFAMEELKGQNEDFADIEENVFNENPDYLHYKTIAEAVYGKDCSQSTSSRFGRILKSAGKIALVGLLIGATVYVSGCLTDNTTNTTTTTSTSGGTASHIDTTTQQAEVYDYLMQKNATEYYGLFKPLENQLDKNEKTLIDEFLALPKDIRENPLVIQKINQIVKDSIVTTDELDAFTDLDNDGFINNFELNNGLNPLAKNPNVFYVYNKTKDIDLAKFVLPLDKDGAQDKNEKLFDDTLIKDSSLISITSYKEYLLKMIGDGKVTDIEVDRLNNSSKLVNILYNATINDNEISNKIDSTSLEFDILSKLNKYNLTEEQLAYIVKFSGYSVDNDKDVYKRFSLSDINNTLYLIEKHPIIYTGASKKLMLNGLGSYSLTYLVRLNYTESEKMPYVTWALAEKTSIITEMLNNEKISLGYISRKDIHLEIDKKYDTNSTFIELVEKRRKQILKAHEEDLWLIGLTPEEIMKNVGNSPINTDIAILHVTLPFSLISGDDLLAKNIYPYYIEQLNTNPEGLVIFIFNRNLDVSKIGYQIFKDYKNGKLNNIDDYILNNIIKDYEQLNYKTARDIKFLYENGSHIFKYGYIAKVLAPKSSIVAPNYGLPEIPAEDEENRVSVSIVIASSVGVPVYGGTLFTITEVPHGLAYPIITPNDEIKLLSIDNSTIIYDRYTRAISIGITRESANYFKFLNGKILKPFMKASEVSCFPIPRIIAERNGLQFNDYYAPQFKYSNSRIFWRLTNS